MLNRKISFGVSWSLIGCAAIFCFYTAQLLIIVSESPIGLLAIASTVPEENSARINLINKKENVMKISTNYGDIEVELYPEKSPKTVANFEKLAKAGFYEGIKFHRVIKGFMIQAGDPFSKDDSKKSQWGTGGPGYKFADELKGDEKYTRGILAMANAGPNTNGSQFFIMHQDQGLPPAYTVFGRVVSGIEVVDKIANVPTYLPNQVDRPLTDVVIQGILGN